MAPSPLAVASVRARWPAALAWSYAPMKRKWIDKKIETRPSLRGSSSVTARVSASRSTARVRPQSPRAERRPQREPQIDGLFHARRECSGMVGHSFHARSKNATASRTPSAHAVAPPAGSTPRALCHTSPRTAWSARRSTWSASRSPVSVSRASTICACSVTSALLEQAAVRHFVRQSVLESVLVLREEARLVQKLGRQEVCQPIMQCCPRAARQWPVTGTGAPPCQ